MKLTVNGEPLAYRRVGHGEPLVLVHANISDMRSWSPLEALLADHFHVITYSRRFAYPNRPIAPGADDPFEVHAEDLVALIEAQRLGPVHVLGNSSGAFIALLAARQRPDLVRSLSLEEPPVMSMFTPALPPRPTDVLRLLFTAPGALAALVHFGARTMAPSVDAFRRGDDEAALHAFGRGVLGNAAYARATPARRAQMRDNLAAHRAALLGVGLPSFTPDEARAVAVPTQLLRGAHTSPLQRRVNRRLAALIPGARDVVVPGASHFVHEDNPSAVAAAMLDFTTAWRGGRHGVRRSAADPLDAPARIG